MIKGDVCALLPRIDMCELYKRMTLDFSCPISQHCTVTQTLISERLLSYICHSSTASKFYQTFDLLIIDEVDAFPFVDSRSLSCRFKCRNQNGKLICYLPHKKNEIKGQKQEINALAYLDSMVIPLWPPKSMVKKDHRKK